MKIAAVLFLLLGVIALEAAGAEVPSAVPMREIDAGEILAKVQKGDPVEYDHIVVRGDLDLSRERLQKDITTPIRINDSMFIGLVNLNGTTFEKPVDLSGCNFTGDTFFSGSIFKGDADFSGAIFSGIAFFVGAKFSDFAYFERATFSSVAHFEWIKFNGKATFRGAEFREFAGFWWTTFRDFAEFWGATFSDDADFRWVLFSEDANFMAAFSKDAEFGNSKFSEEANFRGAEFSQDANFWDTKFSGYTVFWSSIFSGNASFGMAEFNDNTEFGGVRFENDTCFYGIFLQRPAYYENCSIKSLNLTKAEYGRLHLRWDDIESLHFDEAAYLALIKNYNNLGWYGDANRCYYDYRNAVRRSWQAASSPGFAAKVSSLLDRFVDFGEWILYGYGVRPSFPIAWSVGIILAFGLFLRQKRCLRKIITEEKIEDAGDGSDEVLVESKARKAPINFLDPFLFSLFTFTSGFTAFLHPAVEYKLERCLRWAIFERLLGPFFLALVITAISKTYLIR